MRIDICVLRRSKENWKNRNGYLLEIVYSFKNVDNYFLMELIENFTKIAREFGFEKGMYYIRPNFGGKGIGFGKTQVVIYD